MCFADPLGGTPAARWDAEFAATRFYSSSLWLRLCALPPGSVPGAVIAGLEGGGRTAMPVAAVHDEPNAFSRWDAQLAARGLPGPPGRGILVGQRRGYQAELLTSPGADRREAASALLARLHTLRKERLIPGVEGPLPCVAMYLTTPDVVAFRDAGVQALPVLLETDAWIPVPPGGWQEWVDTVARRRAERLREVRAFERAGYRVGLTTLAESAPLVGRLLAQTQERYGTRVDLAAYTASFRRQGELAGAACEVLLCGPEDGEPVGFCMFFRWGETFHVRATGLDYGRLQGGAEYFNLAFHLPVRLAAEAGLRWLHAGISTPEAKALRGAQLRPLWLLDLSEDSVLVGRYAEIRAHNRRVYDGLVASSRAVETAMDPEAWRPFCG